MTLYCERKKEREKRTGGEKTPVFDGCKCWMSNNGEKEVPQGFPRAKEILQSSHLATEAEATMILKWWEEPTGSNMSLT